MTEQQIGIAQGRDEGVVIGPHEPTPWQIELAEQGDCDAGPDGGTVSWSTGEFEFEGRIVAVDFDRDDWAEVVAEAVSRANAEFIVRACNSHDSLLAACRAALAFINNGVRLGYILMPEQGDPALLTPDLLRRAIAQAEAPAPEVKVPGGLS